MAAPPPIRVSILVPNYNNGRQSSLSGRDDLIGDLLESLDQTLATDATGYEILAYDDGSTDDSLQTLRRWAGRRRPDNQPFLELLEAEHCGVLARIANILSRRAAGDILVRLDGDIVCLTPHWVSWVCELFDQGPPDLGVIGPKQLAPDRRTILGCGDWVLHPNGYTHVGFGLPRAALAHAMEVDHVMGCFYCCRRRVFEQLGGYDEQILRGQTVDFGLRARLAGWRCLAVPQIEFVHAHCLRSRRSTHADSDLGIRDALGVFQRKWGFDRLAPDLDEVRRAYRGTPLLWNQRWFGPQAEAPPAAPATLHIADSDWNRYVRDAAFRKHADMTVRFVIDMVRQVGKPRLALQVGCGDGLLSHLIATTGLTLRAVDTRPTHLALARGCAGGRKYPGAPPSFDLMPDHCRIPLDDGAADLVLLLGQLEHHPSPVALFRELRRVTGDGKHLLVVSQRAPGPPHDPSDPTQLSLAGQPHYYAWPQLLNQIIFTGGWRLLVDPAKDNPARDMVVAAQRWSEPAQSAGALLGCAQEPGAAEATAAQVA